MDTNGYNIGKRQIQTTDSKNMDKKQVSSSS